MRKFNFVLIILLLISASALAQGKVSFGGFAGFNKPSLDKIRKEFDEFAKRGATVDKFTNVVQVGGFLGYQASAKVVIRLEAAFWEDKGSANFANARPSYMLEQEIRLIPIMIGAQYYLGRPETKARIYFGASGGVINVKGKESSVAISNIFGTPDTLSSSGETSFTEFIFTPFAGVKFFSDSRLNLFAEAGYMIAKYPTIKINVEVTGFGYEIQYEPAEISLNGLRLTVGLKYNL